MMRQVDHEHHFQNSYYAYISKLVELACTTDRKPKDYGNAYRTLLKEINDEQEDSTEMRRALWNALEYCLENRKDLCEMFSDSCNVSST